MDDFGVEESDWSMMEVIGFWVFMAGLGAGFALFLRGLMIVLPN